MQTHAAVFRDGPTLQEGCDKMNKLYKEMDDLKVGIRENPSDQDTEGTG